MKCEMLDESRFSGKARNFSVIAATMVVLIHSGRMGMPGLVNWWIYQLLAMGLATFAVPGFFLVSGYYLANNFDEPRWWRRAVSSRMRTLLVPYLIWNLLYSICAFLLIAFLNLSEGRHPLVGFSAIDWGILCLGLDPFRFPKLIPLWYVRALLLLVLVSPLLWWLLRRLKWWLLLLLFPLQIYLCGVCDRYDPTMFLFYGGACSMAGFVYFSIGILLRRFGVPCMILARKWMVWFLIAIVVIGVGRGLVFVGHRALGDCCWVLGIPFLLLSVWGLLPAKPWPQWLVSSAFPVYLLHLFNVQVVELMFSPYTVDWWVYPLRMVVVLAVSLFEVSLIRRHAPTAKFLFGGR